MILEDTLSDVTIIVKDTVLSKREGLRCLNLSIRQARTWNRLGLATTYGIVKMHKGRLLLIKQ